MFPATQLYGQTLKLNKKKTDPKKERRDLFSKHFPKFWRSWLRDNQTERVRSSSKLALLGSFTGGALSDWFQLNQEPPILMIRVRLLCLSACGWQCELSDRRYHL